MKRKNTGIMLIISYIYCTNVLATNLVIPSYLNRVGVGFGQTQSEGISTAQVSSTSAASDELSITQAIEQALPGIQNLNNYSKAVWLRNYVYQNTTVGSTNTYNFPLTFAEFQQITSGQQLLECDGIASFYMGLLQLFGVPNRVVSLADSGAVNKTTPDDTHTTVEILDNNTNSWVIEDPTFNVEWLANNSLIDSIQFEQDVLAGITPVWSTDGYSVNSNRSVTNYYLPYADLMEHIFIGPATSYGAEAGIYNLTQSYPDTVGWLYPFMSNPLTVPSNPQTSIATWDFSQGISNDWELVNPNATEYSENSSTYILTDNSNFHYILQSNSVSLNPGTYQLIIDGVVNFGGLSAVIVNQSANDEWLAYGNFYAQQFPPTTSGAEMVVNFTVTQATNISILLNNFSLSGTQSSWDISQIILTQLSSSN